MLSALTNHASDPNHSFQPSALPDPPLWSHRSWTGGDMGDYRLAHLCYCTAVFFEYERAEYRNQRD